MAKAQSNQLSVMTFNVENLFDTLHDKGKEDQAFLPEGSYKWTEKRLNKKLYNLADVISEVGGDKFPEFVGLVEVENEHVLQQLLTKTGLRNAGYKYYITDGDDIRGIDVALLYLPDIFKVEKSEEWKVRFKSDPSKNSRNVLHLEGVLYNEQRVHFMVVHLPSRRDGAKKTDPFRRDVISLLQSKCDSILQASPSDGIIIMGDFNATPRDKVTKALAHLLKGRRTIYRGDLMYDVTSHIAPGKIPGSYYFRGHWEQLDRIVISGNLMPKKRKKQKLSYKWNSAEAILIPRYLSRGRDGRQIPKRTYGGPKYIGGVSDHLPVVAKFKLSE